MEDYAYSKVLTAHALKMEASNGRPQEDIRNQWTTYEKMLLWFKTTESDLIKLGPSQDKAVYDDDGTVIEECFIPDDCKEIMVNLDEMDYPLSNEDDKGGPRARTYTNPHLPIPGGSSTLGNRHKTGVYGTSALGETLHPLCIFDSVAKTYY